MKEYDTIVVGGGITGLGCAEALQRGGRKVLVLEARERVGGCLRTDSQGGFVLDRGPQTIRSADPALRQHLDTLGMADDRVVGGRAGGRRYLVHGGRPVAIPGSPPAALTTPLLSWRGKLRVLREPWVPRGVGEDETVASFFGRRLGNEVRDGALDALIGGIHAGDPTALSMRAVFPSLLKGEREHGSLVRWGLAELRKRRAARAEGAPPAPRAELFSFRGGLGAWPARIAAWLGDDRVRTGATVEEVRREAPGWVVSWREAGSTHRAKATSVVLAVPAHDAADVVERLSPAASRALRDIPYSPVAVVHLAYPRAGVAHALDGFGILAPSRERAGILGILWCSSLFPDHAPPGTVLTATFVGGMRDPAAVRESESQIVRRAHLQHQKLLGAASDPVFASVQRWTHAIPQAEMGHAERIGVVEALESTQPGLHITGSFRNGTSVPACWAEGRRVANLILAGRGPLGTISAPAPAGSVDPRSAIGR
jgi:protoporphyrinogen/coproporphyrinogen III oxidase